MYEVTVFGPDNTNQGTFRVDTHEELGARLAEVLENNPGWSAEVEWVITEGGDDNG